MKKSYIVITCIIWACFLNSVFGVEYTLEVLPGVQQQIESAYPYKHLSKEEKAKAYTVFERTYVILDAAAAGKSVNEDKGEPGSTNIAIVPNLNPCVCVVIHYGPRVAVFHQHYSSNTNDLIVKTKTHLGINGSTNPGEIKIYIYAFKAYNYDMQWRDKYQKRSQEEELAYIKTILMQNFGIIHDSQVESCLWTPKTNCYEYCTYYGLNTSIVVSISAGNELKIYNTSVVHEEVFFQNQYPKSYFPNETVLRNSMTRAIQGYVFDRYQTQLLESPKYKAFYNVVRVYGVMPYMRALRLGQYFACINISKIHQLLYEQTSQMSESLGCVYPIVNIPQQEPIPCYICGKKEEKMSRCTQCKEYLYCSRECQKSHWGNGGHKGECQVLKL